MSDEITPGEVYRLFQAIDKRLEGLSAQMVGRAEYAENQKGIDRRFEGIETSVRKVATDLSDLEKRIEATEKAQKEARSKWTFQLVFIFLAPIAAFLVGMVLRGTA